jgi:iron complex outermembrane receptor protein
VRPGNISMVGGFSTALVYYYADNRSNFTFERGDLILSYTRALGDTRLNVMLKGEYLFDNDPLTFRDYRLDDKQHFYAGMSLEF